MESNLSCLSSLKEEGNPVYVQPHYKESYRLAIYALVCGGREAYEEFLKAEQISHFLSEEEIYFILENAELPVSEDDSEAQHITQENGPSTYFPTESDEEVPELDLGWPKVDLDNTDTSISLLFHPPRPNTPTIKDVVRKQIQDAKQVIAIAMDVFTDVDIFKEMVSAALRGVVVYILLDDFQVKSFLNMSERLGVKIQDLKNIRVRTVKGPQYQCRSAVKFHGALEQRFLLVDCSTVLYGTYSYTWSFEKINVSMVLVITGQLVASYDEEFRRLYARSTVPVALCQDRLALRQPVPVYSPNSSQLSINLAHMRSRVTQGLRSSMDDRYHTGSTLTRGLSMQERLHQSHHPDVGNLVRGHSYGGELQRINSTTRLRTGAPERPKLDPPPLSSRVNQLHHQQRSRFSTDQYPLPYNSENSLHRWKMDSYFNNNDVPADMPYNVTSPHDSQTGLNENRSQPIQGRVREIRSRLEEIRMKRLSLQEYSDAMISPRQSQESLRSAYSSIDRSRWRSSLRALGKSCNMSELEQDIQHGFNPEPAYLGDGLKLGNQQDEDGAERGTEREQPSTSTALTDGHRSISQYDIKTASDRKTAQTHDWHEPLSRTTSAANLDGKLTEPSLKPHHLRPSGVNTQHSRLRQSLVEIPEEKEGLTRGSSGSTNKLANSSGSVALTDGEKTTSKDEVTVPKVNSTTPNMSVGPQHPGVIRESHDSVNKMADSSDSAALKDRKKTTSNEETTVPKGNSMISNVSAGSQLVVEVKGSVQKVQAQREEPTLQSKNSIRSQETPTLQSNNSIRSQETPTLQSNNSIRSQETPTLQMNNSIKSKETPTLQSKNSIRSQETPTLQSNNSIRSKETPTLQRKNSTRSKETPILQRKNSIKSKVLSILTPDERKTPQKEEKTLQRKSSKRSKTPSGSNPLAQADISTDRSTIPGASPVGKPSASEQTPSKGQTTSPSRSHHAISGTPETERRKPPFPQGKASPQHSSTRKMTTASDKDRGSRITLEGDGSTIPQVRMEKAYSRFEHFLTTERNPVRTTAMHSSDKERGSFMRSNTHSYSRYQTQPATDNKLGRFMQRVGNLIGKNK